MSQGIAAGWVEDDDGNSRFIDEGGKEAANIIGCLGCDWWPAVRVGDTWIDGIPRKRFQEAIEWCEAMLKENRR